MTQASGPVRQLVYGASPFVEAGHGEIFDAAELVRLGAAATAQTWRELVEAYYGETYETFVDEYEVGAVGDAGDPANFEAWYSDSLSSSPQQRAWEVAGPRVAALTEADPAAFPGLVNGGATPFGHEDSISGPLESLKAIAERIDPETDGFSLERDDAAIAATFGRLFS